MSSSNGTGRKRIEEEFTFESTGVTVHYTRVPLQLIIDFESGWKRKNKAPKVPQSEVEIGGEKKVIENPSDPEYQQELSNWESNLHNASYRYMIKKALVLSVGDGADVIGLRREVEEAGSELDPDDSWVFLFNIASTDPNEIGEFQNAILRLSQPTKEAVEDSKARFPSHVQET